MGRKHHSPTPAADGSWADTLTHNRRFPKRGAPKRTSAGVASNSTFNVQSILGSYAVKCSVLEKAHEKHKAAEAVGGSSPVDQKRRGSVSDVQMMFDIHGLVQRRRRQQDRDRDDEGDAETEDMEGLEATFDFGVIKGMCLIGGSRRGLREVVQTVEADEEDDAAAAAEEAEEEEDRKPGDYPKVYAQSDDSEGDDTADDDDEDAAPISPSRSRTMFEKNTFRQPKFFFEWRGHDLLSSENVSRGPRSDCMGHLEFSSNACKDFKGTFSSERWGENVAFEGWKVRNKAVECAYAWGQFDTAS